MCADEYIVTYNDFFHEHIGNILFPLCSGLEAEAVKVGIVDYCVTTDPDTIADRNALIAMYGGRADPDVVADSNLSAIIGNKKTRLLTTDPVVPRSVVHFEPFADPKPSPVIQIDHRNPAGTKGGALNIEDLEFIAGHQVGVKVIDRTKNFSRQQVRIFDDHAHETLL
jgi:hypothetical protein